MARTDDLENFLTDVASAIKTKKGTTDKIAAENFDTEIASIDTLNGEEISVIPAIKSQEITPSDGKNAITKVTVGAVTSTIDDNITPENIKKDTVILGVTGTLEEGENLDTELSEQDTAVENLSDSIQDVMIATYSFKPEFVSFQGYSRFIIKFDRFEYR
jgi:hypothetical protein